MGSKFLIRHGMDPQQVDVLAMSKRFQSEMAAGLKGAPSSILMLPTFLSENGSLPMGVPVAVIDAGGTNARVARVTFTPQGPQVEHLKVFPIPGSRGEVSCEEFLDAFVLRLVPFLSSCAALGFCFSFPARITPERDGEVLYFDKVVKVASSQGLRLIRGLNDSLHRLGGDPIRGVVLNDTVAALLGGITQVERDRFDGFLGLIYGTGINTCYSEAVQNISALSDGAQGSMLINTESGSFTLVKPGDFDRQVDEQSKNPGRHLYEKMVSGAYLGEVLRHTLRGAVEENLLPRRFASLSCLATHEMDAFLTDPTGDNPLAVLCRTQEERSVVVEFADALFRRAARLVSANLIAILVHSGLGTHPDRPAGIVAEGSTLYKSKLLFPYLEETMAAYAGEALGLSYRFLRPENANLLGTAAAALLNM